MELRHCYFAVTIISFLLLYGCAEEKEKTAPTEAKVERVEQAKSSLALYLDDRTSLEDRLSDLLSRMTTEEKVAQLTALWSEKKRMFNDSMVFDTSLARQVMPYGIGHITRPSELGAPEPGFTARQQVEYCNAVQKWLREETRLGIPAIMHEESLHGLAARDATSWNQPIGLASSWNPRLARQLYAIAARQTRSRGAHLVLSPVVDVCREPRWGRVEETFGEDPFLSAEMGIAAVQGLQGEENGYGPDKVLATLKHMTGHGQPEGGNNIATAHVSERTLHEVFLYPFRRVVEEAGVANIMASYNEVNGIPSHANDWMFNDLLRYKWGFDGVVVSDYYGIRELVTRHRVAEDLEAAAITALTSGIDIELPDPEAFPKLVAAIENGDLSETVLDRAVSRILSQKFRLGLFENPFVVADKVAMNTPEDDALALQAAEEGMVLLENDSILPLAPPEGKTYAIIGPNADRVLLGGYSDQPAHFVTVREGLENYISARGGKVLYAPGPQVTRPGSWYLDPVEATPEAEDREAIAAAVLVAKSADVVILALGGNELTSREAWSEGHLGDRTSLEPVGLQNELSDAIAALDKPTITLVYGGRPLNVKTFAENSNALFQCWYQGQETGQAVANVLFGETDASGRLPISMPRSAGHLPAYYNHKPTARRGYLFDEVSPLYSFGQGLSYTTFTYGTPILSDTIMGSDDNLTLKVQLTNTGERTGQEVVQLYIRDDVSSVTRPVKELKGFQKITLAPGESKTVSFPIEREMLSFFNKRMEWVVEAGRFILMVGSSSRDEDLQSIILEVRE
ncbi:beta-glucosidase [Lewinellaceae bacterium SD302]|nr:beta-glucosidase [Lewinellaceae bacterium SD302]